MKVVGVDPGSHTGVVVWTDESGGVIGSGGGAGGGPHGTVLEAHEFTGARLEWDAAGLGELMAYDPDRWREREFAIALMVTGVVLKVKPELVVIEDFVLRGGQLHSSARAGLSAMRIQVAIHTMLLMEHESLVGLTLLWYGAALAKGTITDQRLRAWGLWIKGSPHKRDALRHALAGYRKVVG